MEKQVEQFRVRKIGKNLRPKNNKEAIKNDQDKKRHRKS